MRFLTSVLGDVIVATAAVLLTLFALENPQIVSLNFLGTNFSGNVWWLILGAAAVGFLLALLLTVPGRILTSHRAYNLSRLNAQHKQNLAELRDTHAQLQAERDRINAEHYWMSEDFWRLREELVATRSEHDQARQDRDQRQAERDQAIAERDQLRDEYEHVTAERDQLRERLAAFPVATAATASTDAAGYRPAAEPETTAARQDEVVAHQVHQVPEEPVIPAAQPSEDAVVVREPAVTQPARPSLGERIRAAAPGTPIEEAQTEDQPHDADHTGEPGEAASAAAPEYTAGETVAPDATTNAEVTNEVTNAEAANEATAPSIGERLWAMLTGQPVEEVHEEIAHNVDGRAADAEPLTPEPHVASEQPEVEHPMTPMATLASEPGQATEPAVADPEPAPMAAETAATMPDEASPAEAMPAGASATEVEQPTEPSLVERLRSMFQRPEAEETPPPEPAATDRTPEPQA